ncbi:MAG: SDR family oxidoreductase [Deltaproteobacteria bacterium]|nr:SDR family oxidoreductase [Nannocystaceae bacterium]
MTGAGRGIGREIAMVSAQAGAAVVLVARTASQLDEVAAHIEGAGGRALAIPADIAEPETASKIVAETMEKLGRIDVLVNNAATNYVANLVMSKDEGWRKVYELNVFAVMRLTQAALKQMIRRKSGRIINIGSVSGELGASYNSAYASSKAAIDGFTRSVAREVAKLGITSNSIRPWHVDTELVHDAMASRAKLFGKTAEEYLEGIIAQSPQKRLITAREVAALAVFLMSDDARGITGQSLNVCGGFSM